MCHGNDRAEVRRCAKLSRFINNRQNETIQLDYSCKRALREKEVRVHSFFPTPYLVKESHIAAFMYKTIKSGLIKLRLSFVFINALLGSCMKFIVHYIGAPVKIHVVTRLVGSRVKLVHVVKGLVDRIA